MPLKIAQVVVGLPVDGPFDYAIGQEFLGRITLGMRVRVSFNRRPRVGYVVGLKEKSAFKRLNEIQAVLDSSPSLDQGALKLTKMVSAYYGCSWGEAIETALPVSLRQARPYEIPAQLDQPGPALPGQVTLLHDISRHKRWPYILDGIEAVVKNNQSVIFLVPEVFLIDEVVARLSKNYDAGLLAVLDKKLTPKKEWEQWCRIKAGDCRIVIGSRSAIFAPAFHPGLIIIYDEEHGAYKQEQFPHYHVHEVARLRAGKDQCGILFVSSAPSAEMWEQARKKKWLKVTCPSERLSEMQIIDMTNYNPQKTSILSFPLQACIQKQLAARGKVVLFMNRIGFNTSTRCHQCGLTLKCQRCNVNLIYRYSEQMMVCRLCQFKMELPKFCPGCSGSYLRSTGTGIEKLESEVVRFYPQAKVSLYDKETADFPQEADIIIATQAIFKWYERILPAPVTSDGEEAKEKKAAVQLIAVMNFDAILNRFDFRSAQKAFSLLIHLRLLAEEKLLVQTRMADSYCLAAARHMDFQKFYKQELKLRKELRLPPYAHLIALRLRGPQEEVVFEQSKELFKKMEELKPQDLELSDPHPDVLPKLRDKFRYTIVLKGKSVKKMLDLAKAVLKGLGRKKSLIIKIDVDP
ncbi:MAG TPA: primosomal protein N' [Candidatus Omnitrophica bacterium]|nr:MAG: primosomal protein N' [Omnitrophica WOR_2 bacterium GWA2_45_18]HBR14487.1 primosomal protein N' [Candidatus Omnitrophota bacterium]